MAGITDRWIRLFSRLTRGGAVREVDEEIAFHLAMGARELEAEGLPPEEAARRSRQRFGDVRKVRGACLRMADSRLRRERALDLLGDLRGDAAYGFRALRRSPTFAATAVLVLAVSTAAAAAVFGVVDAVLLRPLPYADAGRIVAVSERTPQGAAFAVAPANFLDWRARSTVFESMAPIAGTSLTVGGDGEPTRFRGQRVSSDFFRVLGVPPALGRPFLEEDDAPDAPPVAVLSDRVWRTRFGADPEVVGQAVRLGSDYRTVIGVMPAGFHFQFDPWGVHDVDVWITNPFASDPPTERVAKRLQVVARLAPGVTVEQADAELAAIAGQLAEEHPASNEGWGARVVSLREQLSGDVRPGLLVLGGAVGFLLLIACANLANLLLARGSMRRGELAVRTALGAGRGRLVRQLLVEAALLTLVAAALAIPLAWWALPLLVSLSPSDLPAPAGIGFDGRVLLFTLAISAATTLAFALVPALGASRVEPRAAMAGKAPGTSTRRGRLLGRQGLVVAEVAISLVLLVGAGLLIRSFGTMASGAADLGVRAERTLLLEVRLPRDGYFEEDGTGSTPATENFARWRVLPAHSDFVHRVVAELEAIPGVRRAAATHHPPGWGPAWGNAYLIGGQDRSTEDQWAFNRGVTSEYFATAGIPLTRGRGFTPGEGTGGAGVAVISESLAAAHWPGRDPIGDMIRAQDGLEAEERWFTIVGVAGDVKQALFVDPPHHTIYIPMDQRSLHYADWQTAFRSRVTFVVEAERDAEAVAAPARAAVWRVAPEQPVDWVGTFDDLAMLHPRLASGRFHASVVAILAAIAALVAAAGLYGVIAYLVARRTYEIGVRMAIGARRGQVMRMVLAQAAALAGLGLALGLAGAYALTRFLESMLFEITATDLPTYAMTAGFLGVVALLACVAPALRAGAVDPVVALRTE